MTTTWKAWCPDNTDEDGATVYPAIGLDGAVDIAEQHAEHLHRDSDGGVDDIIVCVSDGTTTTRFVVTVDYEPTFSARVQSDGVTR